MQIFYLLQPLTGTPLVATNERENELQCATLVFRTYDGPLGFQLPSAKRALATLAWQALVLEVANSPRYSWVAGNLTPHQLYVTFKRVATCSCPSPLLQNDLSIVAANHQRSKKNEVRLRHKRPLEPLTPTPFDNWVTSEGRIDASVMARLVDASESLVFWSYSDWGLHGRLVAQRTSGALQRMLLLFEGLGIPCRRVHSERELPSW